jgi:hypothetical protein
MARHRKISVRMYGDEKFLRLSPPPPCGQFLWIYLLTGPHTTIIPGVFAAGELALAEALRWPPEGFRKAFREVEKEGMAKADWAVRFVWIPRAVEHNKPESPNVVKGWASTWDELPECPLKLEAYNGLKAFLEEASPSLAEAFKACRKPFGKPLPNQEQEQEQEQEEEESPEPLRAASVPASAFAGGEAQAPATAGAGDPAAGVGDPEVLRFPVVGGGPSEWPLLQSKLAEYRDAYPGVDVLAECRKALQWCRDNPTRRKTPRGMPAFLARWLAKAQDEGRSRPPPNGSSPPPPSEQELGERITRERADDARLQAAACSPEQLRKLLNRPVAGEVHKRDPPSNGPGVPQDRSGGTNPPRGPADSVNAKPDALPGISAEDDDVTF